MVEQREHRVAGDEEKANLQTTKRTEDAESKASNSSTGV